MIEHFNERYAIIKQFLSCFYNLSSFLKCKDRARILESCFEMLFDIFSVLLSIE